MPQKVITWQKGCIIITSQNTFLNKIIILAKMTQKRRKQRLSNANTQKKKRMQCRTKCSIFIWLSHKFYTVFVRFPLIFGYLCNIDRMSSNGHAVTG